MNRNIPFGYLKRSKRNKTYIPYLKAFKDQHNIPPIRVMELDQDIWPGECVQSIFELFLDLNNLKETARQLTKRFIPTHIQISKKVMEFLTRSKFDKYGISFLEIGDCKAWRGSSVKQILQNPHYVGESRYQWKKNNTWELQLTYPALISQELFQQVQVKLHNITSYKF